MVIVTTVINNRYFSVDTFEAKPVEPVRSCGRIERLLRLIFPFFFKSKEATVIGDRRFAVIDDRSVVNYLVDRRIAECSHASCISGNEFRDLTSAMERIVKQDPKLTESIRMKMLAEKMEALDEEISKSSCYCL